MYCAYYYRGGGGGEFYSWDCVVADVRQPLQGADFWGTNGLMVNLKGHSIIDTC